ncbi:MAG: histidine kinase, partial [Clostridiales bacterium]|nr:histidine kinase [Clostridiales bacterium]
MDIFLARQPIFDADQRVYAYEVLYRSGTTNAFDGINGDEASAKVIINTFQTFGIDRLTNNKPVFINFTESFINDEMATLFPKDSLVVEVLESVNPGDNIVERCRKLKELGYTIALDDFVYSPEYESLLSLV